jgi:ketosteroid isomerase-like protein
MKKLPFALLVVCALVAAGCAKKVDVEGARTALQKADSDWSAAATNVDTFMGFMAPDGAIYPPNEPAAVGTDNVRAWATRMLGMPGFSVSWQSSAADVAASGEMGYTAGTYTLHVQGPTEAISDNGKYLTVWKKDTSGAWKVVYDIFNSDLMPMAAPAAVDTTTAPK